MNTNILIALALLRKVKLFGIIGVIVFALLLTSSYIPATAAPGAPKLFSYQGRLLDSSGNLLGGSGTDYCFRFSIHDAAGAGTKLWPAGTPTAQSITAKNGVFNAIVGSADSLTFDFETTDTAYLNVAVADKIGGSCGDDEVFEDLAPRQRITSSGYSINASALSGFTASQTPLANQIPVLDGAGGLTIPGELIMSGALSLIDYADFNTLAGIPAYAEGRIFYDPNLKTLSYYTEVSGIQMNIGGTLWARVKNETGSPIAKGSVVYVNGTDGLGSPTVALAQANAYATSQAAGIATHAIVDGGFGFITFSGGIFNLDTSSFTEGDTLYLSPTTPGGMTATKPSHPNYSMPLAVVAFSHPTAGILGANIAAFSEGAFTAGAITFGGLDGLTDEDGSNLFWDDTNNRLGVGTNTPASTLDINGKFQVFGATGNLTLGGDITLTGGGTVIASAGALSLTTTTTNAITLDSGTTGAVNIGTGANAKTITIGNSTGATALNINTGTGGITLGDNANTKTINIGGVSANGVDTINIATNSTSADTITIGNANASSALTLVGGSAWSVTSAGLITTAGDLFVNGGDISSSGALTIDSASAITIGGTSATSVSICNTANCDTITIGTNTDADTITIGDSNDTVSLASANWSITSAGLITTADDLAVNGGDITSTGALRVTSATTNAITIDSGTTGAVNIGTGANAKTVTIGNSTGASTVSVLAGTGNITLGTADTTGTLLVLDTKTDSGDPTGVNGGMYYNSNSGKFRCYQAGAWTDCIGSAGAVALSSLTAATTTNTINNADNAQTWQWNTLSSNNALTLSSTSTAAASNAQTLLNISLSGANSNASQTTYGAQIANTHTGTSSTNVGLRVSASGGTNNYGLLVTGGNVGIGNTTPNRTLDVTGTIGGNTVNSLQTNTTNDATITISTGASSYYLRNDTSTTNASVNTNFDITGLPNTDGTIALFELNAVKGVTSGAQSTTVTLKVNGTTITSVASSTTTAASSQIKNFTLVRMNSAWKVIGSTGDGTGNNATGQVVKTQAADATTTSTTLTNTDLFFNIGPNETWSVFVTSRSYNTSSPDNVKFAFKAPTGATCYSSAAVIKTGSSITTSTCGAAMTPTIGTSQDVVSLVSTIINGSTAGVVNLQYAANTGAGTAHIDAGSNMFAFKNVGADLAEMYYTTDSDIGPGTLVAIDPRYEGGVQKTTKAYDARAIGFITTAPGLVLGTPHIPSGTRPVYVALTGRIPVQVSHENGPIFAGDYLTSSSIPGVAMKATKAGAVIGQALMDVPEGVNMVMAFVKNTYYTGESDDMFISDDSSQDILAKLVQRTESSSAGASHISTDRIAALDITAPKITAQTVTTGTLAATKESDIRVALAEGKLFTIVNTEQQPVVTVDGDGNTTFAGSVVATKLTVSEIVNPALTALESAVQETREALSVVTADMQSAVATIRDQVSSVADRQDAIALDLQLLTTQVATLSSGNGAGLTLDPDGGVVVKGYSVFKGGISVDTIGSVSGVMRFMSDVHFFGRPYLTQDSAGFAVIRGEDEEVRVVFDRPYLEQPIVNATITFDEDETLNENGKLTMLSNLFGRNLAYVILDKNTEGFTIRLNQKAPYDITFSWTAFAVKQPRLHDSRGSKPAATTSTAESQEEAVVQEVAGEIEQQEEVATETQQENTEDQSPIETEATQEPVIVNEHAEEQVAQEQQPEIVAPKEESGSGASEEVIPEQTATETPETDVTSEESVVVDGE